MLILRRRGGSRLCRLLRLLSIIQSFENMIHMRIVFQAIVVLYTVDKESLISGLRFDSLYLRQRNKAIFIIIVKLHDGK